MGAGAAPPAGPPETLTDSDYANLLVVPDCRTTIGKRDVALLLRVLGDCGLRSAELRELQTCDARAQTLNVEDVELENRRAVVRRRRGIDQKPKVG